MKFCFVGNIDHALKGHTPGGGQLQIALLARALRLQGQEVVVVDTELEESYVTEDGIQIINVPGWNKGLRGIRLLSNRIPTLKKVLIAQKADFYYVRMRTYMHLIVYWASKKTAGKFIIATASDLDVLSFFMKFKYEYKPKLNLFRLLTVEMPNDLAFYYLLKKANVVVLQHAGQKLSFKKTHQNQIIFPNIFDCDNAKLPNKVPSDYFIHVGALSVLKGSKHLHELIDVINEGIRVVVVGEPVDAYSKLVYARLKAKSNVVLKGRLKHDDTMQLIANSLALINTSDFEGFPNIFLEAWAAGVPVISLNVNPGNILAKRSMGVYCAGDLLKMKNTIEQFSINHMYDRTTMSSYVNEVHSLATAGERFLYGLNILQQN